MQNSIETASRYNPMIQETGEVIASSVTSYTAWAEALSNNANALGEHMGVVEMDEEAVKELTKTNSEFLSIIGSITEQQADYADQVEEINQQYAEGEITMEERGIALQELADKQEEASQRMILSMLQQNLAVDGLSTAEMKYLLETGLQWGIYSQSAVDSAQKAIDKAAELEMEFLALPTDHTMTVHLETTGALAGLTGLGASLAIQSAANPGRTYAQGGRAGGGFVTAGASYLVGENGIEEFTPSTNGNITSNSEMNSGIQLAALVGAIPSARDNAKALARELMKMGVGSR
jgi:hypothetical protein